MIRIAIWIGEKWKLGKIDQPCQGFMYICFKLAWLFDSQQDDAPVAISPCKGWRICLYLLSWRYVVTCESMYFLMFSFCLALPIVPACLSMSSRLAVQCPDPKGVKVVFGRKCSFASCKPRMIDAYIAII